MGDESKKGLKGQLCLLKKRKSWIGPVEEQLLEGHKKVPTFAPQGRWHREKFAAHSGPVRTGRQQRIREGIKGVFTRPAALGRVVNRLAREGKS